ncbi:MAG: hypothetical protein HOI61_00880 [Gammaproteobacteria bacterium]|jgi:hypothetical protein|nr:hypothetical protein [Gammaproteobacteria bacterium]MBT4299664.1 hypothetical protein [Gammaproteobacteria bacterium]MBT5371807.1 hypothetical protein [Gammaproteobacteria bacterium]MBT5687052.1 hypothetical protein [Gammaproteobacteria bacterium]MBT6479073.1 hypothetical protein [Gammaproteobacteria bacterium]
MDSEVKISVMKKMLEQNKAMKRLHAEFAMAALPPAMQHSGVATHVSKKAFEIADEMMEEYRARYGEA